MAVEGFDAVRSRARDELKSTLEQRGIDPKEQENLLRQFDSAAGAGDARDINSLRQIAAKLVEPGAVSRGNALPEPKGSFGARMSGGREVAAARVIDPAKVDFADAGRAIPSQDLETAARFSVPIAASSEGQPLINPKTYPTDMMQKDGQPDPRAGTPYPAGGSPITNWEGKPLEGPNGTQARGQVFFNSTDGKYQGVQTTGDRVLLFNRATPEQRQQLQQYIDSRGGPSALTPQGISELTSYARSIGVGDVYDSDMKYVGSKLTPVQGQTTETPGYGTFTRQNETVRAAVVTGPGTISGLNVDLAPGQQAVLILSAKGEVRHVEARAFQQTYRNPDGSAVSLSQLPPVRMTPQ